MKEYYFKPTTNSGVNAFFDSSVISYGLEDKNIEKMRSERYHHNSRVEKNLNSTDLYINDQMNKFDYSSNVSDSKLIHERDKLENYNLKNNELRDRGRDRKHKVKDRSKDKNKIKGRNKDDKYELKDINNHRKSEFKDLKYESKDRSKHPKDELKDKSKYELKHEEYKYGFKEDYIDFNSKIKRGYGDHKCLLKNNHSKTKCSTKDNDSKMRKNGSKSERRESKYRSEVSATDDCYPEKERKRKSSERRKNSKKTVIAEKPGRPLELAIVKGERISEKERKRNRNSEKRSKSRSIKRVKKIDETSTQRKKSPFNNSKIVTHMHVVKEPRENSRKRNSINTEQTGESMLTEAFYKQNRKFKSCRQSKSGNTDVTDFDKDKTGIKTKIVKDKMDVENNRKDLMNYENSESKDNNFVKKSFNKVTVQDIYKMDNMMEYEMDLKKRFLKKMESNRKRTQISMIGNSSLSNYGQGGYERKDVSPPEKLTINGTIKTSNLSDFETKYKKIRQKRKKYRSMSDLRKTIYDIGDSSVLFKPSTKMISSNLDKTYDENIFDGECSKKSQDLDEEKNENKSLFGTGILHTNSSKTFNREKKRVSFATKCGLISQNSSDDSGEKLVPLKNLKKSMHNLSNIKMNKVGLNKKRNMFNKKSWQYSSKLLKLFRNKSLLFGNDRNLYQCIKKKPRIGENLDTRIKNNDLPWSFKNKINLYNFLLKESSKSIEDEVCKKESELKETNPAPIAEQVNAPSTVDNYNMAMNMTLKSLNINSNQLLHNNISKMNSASFIDKEKIHEKANILSQNSNQVNYDCQNIFHFPHKDNNLKRINDNTLINPNDKNSSFPKSNLGNDKNISYFNFHQDHTTGGSFPDWHNEVKKGYAYGNIKMKLPEKDTNYYSQSFLKPERPFFKKVERNSGTSNNYFRINSGARSYNGEKNYGLNLTNNAKNNQLLRQKRLWNNKSFGKIVNGSAYDPIHSRNTRPPDFKNRLNKNCSDQMFSESRNEVANSVKTLNGFISEVKLNNNSSGENINSSKVIIKDSHKSMLEIKFSDKFSINVNGNEIKVEKFGNNDELKGQLTIVNNNFTKDNEVKTCSDTKLYTSVEKGITENQINSNQKLNQNSKTRKMCKTFEDKSSWTENDDCIPLEVRGNSHHLIVDKNGNKKKGCSNTESSTNCMVDVGTDCLPYNAIPKSMEYIESDRAKHSDIVPKYSSSNHPKDLETSNTPPNRNDTFLDYNVPENKFKTEPKNLLKTMEIINNKNELSSFKHDVGTQYDTIGIACSSNQFQKQTCKIEKSNFFNESEGIKYNKPTFRIGDENYSATINIRDNINNNIDESLGIINSDLATNTFGLRTIQIGLPEEEICKHIVLTNIRKCVDISAPNIPDKYKNSMKNESSDRNMFTYLVKKIKTLINIVSGKFKLVEMSKLDQQLKSKKKSNPTKIKSCISFAQKQKYRVHSDCLNCNNCKGNLKKKLHNSENKLVENENFEKNNSVEEELQLDPTSNFKDIIIDAVEKFLVSNLEFLPTNVEPFQILINNDQTNFDNSNKLQNSNNFRNDINPNNPTNKCRNNICLVSNKRGQHKNNLAAGTSMIKRFFGKDKRKKFNGLRSISIQGSTT